LKARAFLGHARAEDKKLIKELSLEVLALKVPFRKPAVALFLNRSLVAEANFSGINLMLAASEKIQPAGHNLPENIKLPDAHESCKSARPATQLLSVHCLYQRLAKKCKGESIFSQESLWTRFRRAFHELGAKEVYWGIDENFPDFGKSAQLPCSVPRGPFLRDRS
jgi:hypothetical protein